MGIDIIGPENINVFTSINRMIINSCQNLQIPIHIRMKENDRIKRIIQTKKRLIISTRSIIMVLIFIRRKIKLSKIRNFIFESISFDIIKLEEEITAAIMNAHTIYIEIRNIINKSIIINRKRRLGIIEKYEAEKYYLIMKELKFLAIGRIL
jgi:hypothetical protein